MRQEPFKCLVNALFIGSIPIRKPLIDFSFQNENPSLTQILISHIRRKITQFEMLLGQDLKTLFTK